MSREEILLVVASVLFALVAWFLRRLVVSVDEFKQWVREKLEEHDEELTVVKERHRLEDMAGAQPRPARSRS